MKGYKVFNPDWTCRGFEYEVGKTYTHEGEITLCVSGFHFCEKLTDCFNYYIFNPDNKVAEVETDGKVITGDDGKSVTDSITIIRELSWYEVLDLVNIGKGNTGYRNSGNYNSSNYNSGDYNSGYRNSGDCNSGNYNSGNYNSGNYNSSNYNSGNYNSGYRNSGNYNSGYRNSGNCNSGYRNSGNCNSGDCNSGNYNSGYRNSGDYNSSNYNSGCFNTITPKMNFFNKPSDWDYFDWNSSDANGILSNMPNKLEWINYDEMASAEIKNYPNAKTSGGYLRKLSNDDLKKARQEWWDNLCVEYKEIVKALPNFDADIFEECTMIRVKG